MVIDFSIGSASFLIMTMSVIALVLVGAILGLVFGLQGRKGSAPAPAEDPLYAAAGLAKKALAP